jgi:SAM-dependent methyltransferase
MPRSDAWGEAVRAYHSEGAAARRPIIERDDGFVETLMLELLFARPSTWPSFERAALRYVRGRVLDVGCGAGRHAIELQRRGHELVAIDTSPATLAVARARGVKDARLLSLGKITKDIGSFDTVLLLGNNFGLLESRTRARPHLRRLAAVTSERARIVATTRDPYATTDPDHRAYQRRNRARRRMSGQITMRVRFRRLVDPWFDYLFVSQREMRLLLHGTGWTVRRFLGPARPHYAAIIEKGSG